jgi:hypothetical protein
LSQQCFSQKNDSLVVNGPVFKPNPKKALLYAAVIPGGGQIYNRKYWKLPFVYAGYGALIYAIAWNGKYYSKYKKAYYSIADKDPNTNDFLKYVPVGQDVNAIDSTWMKQVLNQKQLGYRNNRDLAIICIVGFYGLTLLDAYVDAQLYDFDITPSLNLHVEPVINYSFEDRSPNFGLQCKLTF